MKLEVMKRSIEHGHVISRINVRFKASESKNAATILRVRSPQPRLFRFYLKKINRIRLPPHINGQEYTRYFV